MKKYLITGAQGLVGAELIRNLALNKNNQIFALSRSKPTSSLQQVTYLPIDFNANWDTNNFPEDIDIIVHLAQSPNFREFPEKSEEVIKVNTLSTLKLLNYAQTINVKKFILASSGGVYGSGSPLSGFNEVAPILTTQNFGYYLSTKICSEIIADNYTDFFDLITLRFFFVYGNGQKQSMLIPRLVGFVQNQQPITLQGNDGIKINPIYVSDAVEAIVKCVTLEGSHKINVGGKEILSLREIGNIIGEITGISPKFKTDLDFPAKDVIGDITKMSEVLITPKISFKEGVQFLINNN